MNQNDDRKMIGIGMLSALAASLCCITPVLAFLSGASGLASAFSWMEPARPWLIALSIVLLGFSWYQKLKPRATAEIQCACKDERKPPFLQSKTFLGIITVLAALMISFPWYGSMIYSNNQINTVIVPADQIETVSYQITGMTCPTCEEHVRHGVNGVSGVIDISADFRAGKAVVRFDRSRTNDEEIRRAIDATGYKVKRKEKVQ